MASTVHLGGRDVSSGAEASGGGKSATADPVPAAAAGLGAAATCLLLAAGYAWVLGEVFLPEAPASALRFVPHLLTLYTCLLYTSPSPRDGLLSRMPSSA